MSNSSINKAIIFGLGQIAEVAYYYLKNDSDYEVAGFTVDNEYIDADKFNNLPVVAFEEISSIFPPDEYHIFIPVSYKNLNRNREEKFREASKLGYQFASYVSSKAWVWEGFKTGRNCMILENNVIQPFVTIGDNCILWSGNHIGHHSKIEDNCFIASHVVISGAVTVKHNCFIGVNATLRDSITIGERCVIGANALIMADAEPEGVYIANSATRAKIPSTRLKKI